MRSVTVWDVSSSSVLMTIPFRKHSTSTFAYGLNARWNHNDTIIAFSDADNYVHFVDVETYMLDESTPYSDNIKKISWN